MRQKWLLLATALLVGSTVRADTSTPRNAPSYTSASIVNAADNQSGPLAPNCIASMYGVGLAFTTRAVSAADVRGGVLPTVLPGTGVRVLVSGIPAGLYYVSPTQINFLVPANLLPGSADIQVALDALAGPNVLVQIAATAPALFQLDRQNAIATRADGSLISPDSPARAGDIVILYATGLGQTTPPLSYSEIPAAARPIKQLSSFQVLLAGVGLDAAQVLYAGVAPGFAGLYQINLRLPGSMDPNPEIRLSVLDQSSPAGLTLPVQP